MLSLILAATLAAATPAAPHPSAVVFEGGERDLFPESVAWDAADGSFYLGSLRLRKIVRIAGDGSVSDFVAAKQDGLWSVLGMKIDPRRRQLWANSCSPEPGSRPLMTDPDPAEAGRTAVHRYDLRSGRLLGRYTAPAAPVSLCFNDLVFAPDGDLYLSAGREGVWRLAAGASSVERWLEVPRDYVNGIAVSGDGRTLFIARHVQGVASVDTQSRTSRVVEVPAGPTLKGVDGLYVHRNALVAVQNGDGPPRILRAPLTPDGRGVERVDVLEQDHPRWAVPTTGVVVGDALYYVATSQLDSFDRKTGEVPPAARLKQNVILRIVLPEEAAATPSTTRRSR